MQIKKGRKIIRPRSVKLTILKNLCTLSYLAANSVTAAVITLITKIVYTVLQNGCDKGRCWHQPALIQGITEVLQMGYNTWHGMLSPIQFIAALMVRVFRCHIYMDRVDTLFVSIDVEHFGQLVCAGVEQDFFQAIFSNDGAHVP